MVIFHVSLHLHMTATDNLYFEILEVESYDLHFLAKFRNFCCLQDKFYLKLLDIVILLQSCPVLQKTYSNLFQIIFHKIKLDYLFNFHPF